MSYPVAPLPGNEAGHVNGHRRNGHGAIGAGDGAEAAVARQIRRTVAERLTRANRTHESATGAPMPTADRDALTRRLITEALDAYATAEMEAGRPPLRPETESRVARTVADTLLGAGGLQPWLNNHQV